MFENGKLNNDLELWAAAIPKIAADKRLPLLDLNAESAAAVQIRQQGQPKVISDIAWKAQLRLSYRFRKLNAGAR